MEVSFKRVVELIKDKGIRGTIVHVYEVIRNRFKSTLPQILLFILRGYFIKKLKKFKSSNVEDVVGYAESFCFGAIRPGQIREELVELLKKYIELNPKYILEIGTANGGTLFCFCKLAPDDATIVSIDLPGGPFGGGYPKWKIPVYQAFSKQKQKLYLIRGDSQNIETFNEVLKVLNGEKIDFLFIDGDHSYEGVKRDFKLYSKLVKPNGFIVLHDIAPNGDPVLVGGVPKFWSELKSLLKSDLYIEMINNLNQIGYGVGIVKNEHLPDF